MKAKFIVIDGKTYKSVDEMPEDVRRKYESAISQLADNNKNGIPDALENLNVFADKNKDGIPDAFEGMVSNVISSTKIIVDGKTYNSVDELPPDVRAKYEQAMGALDANRNGVPDVLEGMMNVSAQASNAQQSYAIPASVSPNPISSSPTIEPETTSGWMLALGALVILGICVAGAFGAWYFFLR